MPDKHPEGKWFIVSSEGNEVLSTRGKSKDEATNKFCDQMDLLHNNHYDWVHWAKRGYKIRKD